MDLGELVEPVAVERAVEHERHQHRAVGRRERDACAREHGHVVFDVLPDLENALVVEERLQTRQRVLARNLRRRRGELTLGRVMAQGDIGRVAGLERERDADEFRQR